tara:strand:+ start:278 stop:1048 length:771 start_codon:yes stop_codon:yes gene_type:complete
MSEIAITLEEFENAAPISAQGSYQVPQTPKQRVSVATDVIKGTEVSKSKFTAPQVKSAKHAYQMQKEVDLMDLMLSDPSFDPVNTRDFLVNTIFPDEVKTAGEGAQQSSTLMPQFLNNFLISPKGQIYKSSALNYISNHLRDISGAAVPETEVVRAQNDYVPKPGDRRPQVKYKRDRMGFTLDATIASAGGAYQELLDNIADREKAGFTDSKAEAMKFAQKRMRTDPEFAEAVRKRQEEILAQKQELLRKRQGNTQ